MSERDHEVHDANVRFVRGTECKHWRGEEEERVGRAILELCDMMLRLILNHPSLQGAIREIGASHAVSSASFYLRVVPLR